MKPSKSILAVLLLAAILAGWLAAISMRPVRGHHVAVPVISENLAMVSSHASKTDITGILSDPNFQKVLHALEQRDGTQRLSEPAATTIRYGGINHIDYPQNFVLPITTNR